jgi:Zn-dependent peptidase ImmA (M78 family)
VTGQGLGSPAADVLACFLPAEGISDDPVWRTLVNLARRRGVDVVVTDWAGRVRSPFDGYFTGPDLRLIVIDRRQPEEQMQEALAHELGHHCLRHHALPLSLLGAPREDAPAFTQRQEREADRFAAKLLGLLRQRVAREWPG